MVVWQLDKRRQGTHKGKTRAEVRGGGKKPWRQKGTGRARIGSRRAPHWRGGGAVFPPTPRSHETGLPVKIRAYPFFSLPLFSFFSSLIFLYILFIVFLYIFLLFLLTITDLA